MNGKSKFCSKSEIVATICSVEEFNFEATLQLIFFRIDSPELRRLACNINHVQDHFEIQDHGSTFRTHSTIHIGKRNLVSQALSSFQAK